MLILTQTTDSIQVVLAGTVAASQANCFVSYRNTTSSSISPLRNVVNTNNTTAVTLVPSPSASNQRVVDYISIFNLDTAPITPTVLFNDNGTTYQLFSAVLQPGEKIEYQEGNGFSVIGFNGGVKTAVENTAQTMTFPWTTVILASDVTNSNATANTLEDVTGLSFSAAIGTYWFKVITLGSVSVTNRNGGIAFNGPTFSNFGFIGYALSGNTAINNGTSVYASSQYNALSGATLTSPVTATPANSFTTHIVEGFGAFTAAGTFQVRHTCTAAGGSYTTRAGTILQYYKVL
jgi:hypothetical protein